MKPTQRKALVGHLIESYRVSIKRACQVCRQSRAGWYQRPKPKLLEPGCTKSQARVYGMDSGVFLCCFLQRIVLDRSALPKRIQADNGPEFISLLALDKWVYENGATLDFSRPGRPTDNAFIESFNSSLRDECLNTNWFMSLDRRPAEARKLATGL